MSQGCHKQYFGSWMQMYPMFSNATATPRQKEHCFKQFSAWEEILFLRGKCESWNKQQWKDSKFLWRFWRILFTIQFFSFLKIHSQGIFCWDTISYLKIHTCSFLQWMSDFWWHFFKNDWVRRMLLTLLCLVKCLRLVNPKHSL